jgi:hypothetical protein
VKMFDFDAFMDDFGRAAKPTMNMSIYRDNYKYACGNSHWFDERIAIVCEGLMKVMLICPENPAYVTAVKIKTFLVFKFKGFESLAGTKITPIDLSKLQAIYRLIRV